MSIISLACPASSPTRSVPGEGRKAAPLGSVVQIKAEGQAAPEGRASLLHRERVAPATFGKEKRNRPGKQ